MPHARQIGPLDPIVIILSHEPYVVYADIKAIAAAVTETYCSGGMCLHLQYSKRMAMFMVMEVMAHDGRTEGGNLEQAAQLGVRATEAAQVANGGSNPPRKSTPENSHRPRRCGSGRRPSAC